MNYKSSSYKCSSKDNRAYINPSNQSYIGYGQSNNHSNGRNIPTSISAIVRLRQILSSDNSFSEEIRELDRKNDAWERDIIRVGVIGVTSSGKSTMINALLGEQLLPAEAKPSSSQLVSCRTGGRREAYIFFERKPTLTLHGSKLTPEVISKYGNENDNRCNKESVRQIEIVSPNLKIPANVELVDSPGLDAYGLDGHEAITMETLLPSIDTCIFVTTCKSNSDLKMQTFLNAAAHHRKPVIIVQNMVDTLRGSVDGKKSVATVANEHINRLKRVIGHTDIADKSSVSIVQISAINALGCRIVTCRGGSLNESGKQKWRESGFENLQRMLNDIPRNISANIEHNHVEQVRDEIERIINEIGSPQLVKESEDPTHYMAEYYAMKRDANNEIIDIISSIQSYINAIENQSIYSARNVEEIKAMHASWSSRILSLLQKYNQRLKEFCRRLNESERDIRYTFIPSHASALRVAKKNVTVEKKKPGFWGGLQRFFTFGCCGYETVTEVRDDWETTKANIMSYLRSSLQDYRSQLSQWYSQLVSHEGHFQSTVDARNRIRREAMSRNLEASKKLTILKDLKALKDRLPCARRTQQNGVISTATIKMVQYRMSPLAYMQYLEVKRLQHEIHQKVYSAFFCDRNVCILSWDTPSVQRFISNFLTLTDDAKNALAKGERRNGIRVIDPAQRSITAIDSNETAAVFVNLTQPGAAKKQIAGLFASRPVILRERTVFVIQDLQEVINGGDLKNALKDLDTFLKSKMSGNYSWFAIHSNPLYNIALLEIQKRRIATHDDELRLAADLRKHLSHYYTGDSPQIISDIARGLKY